MVSLLRSLPIVAVVLGLELFALARADGSGPLVHCEELAGRSFTLSGQGECIRTGGAGQVVKRMNCSTRSRNLTQAGPRKRLRPRARNSTSTRLLSAATTLRLPSSTVGSAIVAVTQDVLPAPSDQPFPSATLYAPLVSGSFSSPDQEASNGVNTHAIIIGVTIGTVAIFSIILIVLCGYRRRLKDSWDQDYPQFDDDQSWRAKNFGIKERRTFLAPSDLDPNFPLQRYGQGQINWREKLGISSNSCETGGQKGDSDEEEDNRLPTTKRFYGLKAEEDEPEEMLEVNVQPVQHADTSWPPPTPSAMTYPRFMDKAELSLLATKIPKSVHRRPSPSSRDTLARPFRSFSLRSGVNHIPRTISSEPEPEVPGPPIFRHFWTPPSDLHSPTRSFSTRATISTNDAVRIQVPIDSLLVDQSDDPGLFHKRTTLPKYSVEKGDPRAPRRSIHFM